MATLTNFTYSEHTALDVMQTNVSLVMENNKAIRTQTPLSCTLDKEVFMLASMAQQPQLTSKYIKSQLQNCQSKVITFIIHKTMQRA